MVHGQKPKYYSSILKRNRCSATKHPNVSRRPYGTLAEGERSETIPMSGHRKRIKVEILNTYGIRSRGAS